LAASQNEFTGKLKQEETTAVRELNLTWNEWLWFLIVWSHCSF